VFDLGPMPRQEPGEHHQIEAELLEAHARIEGRKRIGGNEPMQAERRYQGSARPSPSSTASPQRWANAASVLVVAIT
jgi:hypothetical protein